MDEDIATHRRSRWFAYISSIRVRGNDKDPEFVPSLTGTGCDGSAARGTDRCIGMICPKNLDFRARRDLTDWSGFPVDGSWPAMKFFDCQMVLS
jgi:hypothetical protein